jgi:hypothetical protein
VVCSCLEPDCEHVATAIQGLDEVAAWRGPTSTSSAPPSSIHRSNKPGGHDDHARAAPLARALRLLMQAMLRANAGEVTTAVDEAREAALAAAVAAATPSASRVLARVTASLGSRGSAAATALALTALAELVTALEGGAGDERRGEVTVSQVETAPLDDLDLVEVSRARERGAVAWESRLLVELRSGTLYREEGPLGGTALSAGVCGRRVLATLASRLLSCEPARVRLLQYTLEPTASETALAQAAEAASRTLVLPDAVRAGVLLQVAAPQGLWLAPASISFAKGACVLVGGDGTELALDATRDPGAFEALGEALDAGVTVRALAGVAHVDVDGVRVVPQSVLIERGGKLELLGLSL